MVGSCEPAIFLVSGNREPSMRTNEKISAVNLVQATATAGREQAFSYLQQYAIDSQGSNFGNLSGATYTTDAFKQALDSAISKLS